MAAGGYRGRVWRQIENITHENDGSYAGDALALPLGGEGGEMGNAVFTGISEQPVQSLV